MIQAVGEDGFGCLAVNGLSDLCRLLAPPERLTPVNQSDIFLVLI